MNVNTTTSAAWPRNTLDVSELPSHAFSHRSPMW